MNLLERWLNVFFVYIYALRYIILYRTLLWESYITLYYTIFYYLLNILQDIFGKDLILEG